MPESPLQPKKMTWRGRSNLYTATLKGYGEIQILSDVGSGLNENREGFLRLLEMVAEKSFKGNYCTRDRLTRFGFETLRKLFQAFGTAVEVINS
jgi:predicted site-specific integrase-resolvase